MAAHVFLLLRTLLAVVGIRDPRTAADNASALVGAIVAFIADAHKSAGAHVRVADGALAVAFLAETSHSCSGAAVWLSNKAHRKEAHCARSAGVVSIVVPNANNVGTAGIDKAAYICQAAFGT